jgi:hypothetical protein
VVVAPALIELGTLALVLLCLALALIIVSIMRKVGDVFRVVPVVGGYIAGAVESVAQSISGVLGKAITGVDSAMGASWHLLARLTGRLWHQIEDAATGFFHLAELVARLVYAHSGLRTLVHHVEHVVHGIEHGVRTLEREWRGIEHKVKRLERDVTKGIGHDLHIGLRDLRKEVKGLEHTVTTDIPNAIDYAEGQTTALGRFIGAIPGVSYVEWAAGIVAAALGLDLLNSLRCPSLLKSAKNRGCGLWNGLEDMLGLLVDVALIASICDVLPWLTKGVDEVGLGMVEAIHAAGLSACAGTYPPPPPMPAVALHLPTVYGTALTAAG